MEAGTLAMSAWANHIIFGPIWSSCMHKCILRIVLKFIWHLCMLNWLDILLLVLRFLWRRVATAISLHAVDSRQVHGQQVDQIGRIFAIFCHGQYFWKLVKITSGTSSALILTQMGRATFWAIFSQTHLGSMLWSQFSAIFDNFRRKN
jgi:hypothetical protein